LIDPSALVLVAIRMFMILLVQPHWRAAAGLVWPAVAATIALACALPIATIVSAPPLALSLVVAEVALGAVIGLVVALGGFALVGAASTGVALLRVPAAPWIALALAFVLASGLELGLHRPGLLALADVADVLPPGRPLAWANLDGARVVTAAHAMLLLAFTLATPILLGAVAVELALAVAGRGPGGASAFAQALAPTGRLAAVLVALGASWAIHPSAWMPSATAP
jgi:hypothetical protein